MLLVQEFSGGVDVISGCWHWQTLRYIALLTTVLVDIVASSTSETTYLQYLNGIHSFCIVSAGNSWLPLYAGSRGQS